MPQRRRLLPEPQGVESRQPFGINAALTLIQFRFSRGRLGSAGLQRGNDRPLNVAERYGLMGVIAAAVAVVGLSLAGVMKLNPIAMAHGMTTVILGIGVLYFVSVFLFCGLTKVEKERMAVILVLFLASALFWSGFEQAGSSFNLFAERMTNRHWLNLEIPAGWYQSLGAVFIIAFAPVFASLWCGWRGGILIPRFR
jgi:POT family proton-dependent oligopeptide transporter